MTDDKTLFTRIIEREIPAEIVFEDDRCLAFRDINPQAPVHVLVIPKQAIPSIAHLRDEDADLMGHLFLVVRDLAEQFRLQGGYRTVINTGKDGGQTVDHLHIHLMGQRAMDWPPG